jgi:hypothetical protein
MLFCGSDLILDNIFFHSLLNGTAPNEHYEAYQVSLATSDMRVIVSFQATIKRTLFTEGTA